MLRKSRLVVPLMVWMFLVSAKNPEAVAEHQQATAQAAIADRLDKILTLQREAAERAERPKEGKPCQPSEDGRYSELCAAWKAADASMLAAWLGIASTAGVIAALGLTLQSNRIARDTARRELRAYVVVDTIEVGLPGGLEGVLLVKVAYKNVGATPAREVVNHLRVQMMDGWDQTRAVTPIVETPNPAIGVMPAGGHSHTTVAIEDMTADYVLQAIKDGRLCLIAFGFVRYTDIFGEKRTTSFRQFLNRDVDLAQGQFAVAHIGNDFA